MSAGGKAAGGGSPLAGLLRFCLEHKLVVGLAVLFIVGAGVIVAPFDWEISALPRDPVPVDAIPDLGEKGRDCHCTRLRQLTPHPGCLDRPLA